MIGPTPKIRVNLSIEEFQIIRDLKSIEHENYLLYQESQRYGSADAFMISIDFSSDDSVYALKLETIKGEESPVCLNLRLSKRYSSLVKRATSLIKNFNMGRQRKMGKNHRRGRYVMLYNYHFVDGEGNVI